MSELKRRRGGGEELLAYKAGGRWVDVRSADINAYVKEAAGGDFSAKDFRTWNATVLAAVALAVPGPARERRRAQARQARPSRRWPATSATRRRSPAPRISTRACSTASTAG